VEPSAYLTAVCLIARPLITGRTAAYVSTLDSGIFSRCINDQAYSLTYVIILLSFIMLWNVLNVTYVAW